MPPRPTGRRRGARRRAALGAGGRPGGFSAILGRLGAAAFGGLRGLALSVLQGGFTVLVDFSTPPRSPPLPPGALSQAQPVPTPAPQPAPIPGTPQSALERIFQSVGRAANDPVFRRTAVGRISGIGAILVIGAELLIKELERRQLERIEQEAAEADEEAADEIARRRRAREIASIRLPDRLPLPVPPGELFPPTPDAPPQRVTIPQIVPTPSPDVPTLPGTARPLPSPTPSPRTLPPVVPLPVPGTSPTPTTAPQQTPVVFPSVIPFFEPFSPLTATTPARVPVGDPLTGFEAGTVPSQQLGFTADLQPRLAQAAAQAQQCPARRCDDELDEPRTQCFKGLYREGLLDTDFTSWTEIDCVTGQEIPQSAVPAVDFPELRSVT